MGCAQDRYEALADLHSRWAAPVVPPACSIRVGFFVIQLPSDGLQSSGPRIPIAFS